MLFRGLILFFWSGLSVPVFGLSLVTYNVLGNGAADWSTNAPQVQAIGRQMLYLQPDVVTFQEIPFDLSHEMTNFVKAYLPGYDLAHNSGTDGYIRSVIASRFPIVRSQKWLDGVSLAGFGASGTFTRDLFEAEIHVPGWTQPLHVFTTHLKAGIDSDSASRRAAEAGAISNFLVTTFLPANGDRPYVLTGDLNEDINRAPGSSRQPIQSLVNSHTGLRLTTPVNPITRQDFTRDIQTTLNSRFDYILPGELLFSNIATSQVFRTDVLNPVPPPLQRLDDKAASDHLPVWMVFDNPFVSFRLTSVTLTNGLIRLAWPTTADREYDVEISADLQTWTRRSTRLQTTGTNLIWSHPATASQEFFRIRR
jgi:endonuclease/exonuclease/phosphatase family metal-dependent hydrolase